VRDVFAANLPQFKQALEAQGLQVSALSVAVRAETGNQGQAQPQWQQPQWQPAIAEETPQLPAAWNAFSAPVFAGSSSTFNALA
jgi:flagellar hook-length control protein FliK